MNRLRTAVIVVVMVVAVLPPVARADVCQPCTEQPKEPKIHGRSLKSYYGVANGDPLVLAKAFDQGHLALCGTPDQWEWNMFMGIVSAELGKSLLSTQPAGEAQADSLRAQTKHKFELAGCYFAEALKHTTNDKDRKTVKDNRVHYWVEQFNQATTFLAKSPADTAHAAVADTAPGQTGFEQALERYDLAVLIDSTNCQGYSNKGATLINLKQYEEAITTLENGLSICQDDSMLAKPLFAAYLNRGIELFNNASDAKGDSARQFYTQALGWYQKAREMEPEHLSDDQRKERDRTLYQAGITHLRLVDLGDVANMDPARKNLEEFLEKAEEGEDKATTFYYLTWMEIKAKDWTKAEKYVDEYLKLVPRDANGYQFKSVIVRETKGPEASTPYFVFYQALDKGQVVEDVQEGGGELAQVIQEKGKPDELRSYTDSDGNRMVSAFYLSKGEGFAFYGGKKLGSVTFKAETP